MKIRRFEIEDEEKAKQLMIQLCQETGTDFNEKKWFWGVKRRIYDALQKNGMLLASDEDTEKVIGMIFSDIRIEPTGISTGYIRTVIVDSTYRKKGVGKALITEAIKYLKNLEVDKIRINVRSEMKSVYEFYKSLGFKESYVVMELE